jgi:predicted  nucleic acid-binding Zn-ribbon protein
MHSEQSMPSPTIEKLLILQDRDTKRLGVEAQATAVPREIAAVEQRIGAEKAAIDAAKGELRELESKKKLIETEIGSAETLRGKYQTQQLSVKKNDEYQALGHQIQDVQRQIEDLEGKELEAMYGIDEAKKRFILAETTLKQNIVGHEARIRTMKERDASLVDELKAAKEAVAEARVPVPEAALQAYDVAARRRMPAVVPIRGGKCGGCHLKVSSEVESAARGKTSDTEFAHCDQCGQMVFWES